MSNILVRFAGFCLGGLENLHKRDQGKLVRGVCAFLMVLFLFVACRAILNGLVWDWATFDLFEAPGLNKMIEVRHVIAAVAFLAGLFGIFAATNAEAPADFLIETEGELKKVSWPSRPELMGSSIVVIVTVVVLGVYIWGVDIALTFIRKAVLKGF